jgi:C1A family cysteine protease
MGNYISEDSKKSNQWGWVGDIPDVRDNKAGIRKYHIHSKVDLRDKMPEVYTQGVSGSCTVDAVCGMLHFLQSFELSRLFVYYNLRKLNGCVGYNSSCSIRQTLKSINAKGACTVDRWPYHSAYFSAAPSSDCYSNARLAGSISYKRLSGCIKELKMCLSTGIPFVFGYSVYSSFEDPTLWNPKIDEMPTPNPNKETLLGGGCSMAVGYSDKRKCFIIRNNRGSEWGLSGYFFMPYTFITSTQCRDFWTITKGKIQREYTIVDKENFKETVAKETVVKNETLSVMIPKKDSPDIKSVCMIRD